MPDRAMKVLKIAVGAYLLIGVVVAVAMLGLTARDTTDPQTLLALAVPFTLFWPIVLIVHFAGWFRK